MDEHVPGFRLFDLQHFSWALTQRKSLKKLIPFAQGRSPPKDSGLQSDKRDERALLRRFVHVPTTCPGWERVQQGDSRAGAGAGEKLLHPQESERGGG